MKFLFSLPAFVILLLSFVPSSGASFSDDHATGNGANDNGAFQPTKKIMQRYVQQGKVAGSVLVVAKDGKVILHHAAGMRDREAGDKMQLDSLFRIASQTKALTSVAILMLAEEGKLSTSDPIEKFFPSFKYGRVLVRDNKKITDKIIGNITGKITGVEARKRSITIHDLLTHTSGISYGWGANRSAWAKKGVFDWYFADKKGAMADFIPAIATMAHDTQPGEAFVYGHSTDILGAIIAKVSGKSLRQYFKENITQPLGMKDTDFIVPSEKLSRLAVVYNGHPKETKSIKRAPVASKAVKSQGSYNYMVTQGHYSEQDLQAFSGGAGLVSTAADYTKFLMMLAAGGSYNGVQILKPDSVAAMTRNQIPAIKMGWNDGFGYGFSLQNYKKGPRKGSLKEYGWGGAYHSSYVVFPAQKVTIVYLTQVIPAGGIDDWETIKASIVKELSLD